jgi:RNA-directed DNA polymerase
LWDVEAQVGRINRRLTGWANYFCLGAVSKAYRLVQHHTRHRLRQWLCRKHGVQERKYMRFPDPYLHEELGLVRLTERTRDFAWAKS